MTSFIPLNTQQNYLLVGWFVVFYVPSTARSFRDGTPIYCPLQMTWSSVFTPFPPGIEPWAVVWQSITLGLDPYMQYSLMSNSIIMMFSVVFFGLMSLYAHRTLHDATRQDNPRQENRVMCGGLRHDVTWHDKNWALSQISSIVRSLTTRPEFCLVVSLRVVDPAHYTIFLSGVIASCRVVSYNVRWALTYMVILWRWLLEAVVLWPIGCHAADTRHDTPPPHSIQTQGRPVVLPIDVEHQHWNTQLFI